MGNMRGKILGYNIMLRHRLSSYIQGLRRIKLNLLVVNHVLDFVFQALAVVGVVPRIVRMLGAFRVQIALRRGGLGVLRRIP